MKLAEALDSAAILLSRLIRLDFKGIARLIRVNTLFDEKKILWNFSNLNKLFNYVDLNMPSETPSELPEKFGPIPSTYEHEGAQKTRSQYVKERRVNALLVAKEGALHFEEYYDGVTREDLHISWSMSKSVTSTLLGILIDRGEIPEDALDYQLVDHLPNLKNSGYDGATLRNVLNMASGVAFNEDYYDYHSDINRLGRVIGVGGSVDEFAASLTRQYPPGTYTHYVSVDTHVLGMMIRALTGKPMSTLLNSEIVAPMGFEGPGYFIADGVREPFVLGGMNMMARDYMRVGLMIMNNGHWNGRQIVSEKWIQQSVAPSGLPPYPEIVGFPEGDLGYGFQWWIPKDPEPGEFFALGIYGQYIYIHQTKKTVIVQHATDLLFDVGKGAVNEECISFFRKIAHDI